MGTGVSSAPGVEGVLLAVGVSEASVDWGAEDGGAAGKVAPHAVMVDATNRMITLRDTGRR
jgi:hypothetical protein